ncbi:unnamed protein product, partial [Polarella glacialis]
DAQMVLWESSDALEPWAPTELCSVILGGASSNSNSNNNNNHNSYNNNNNSNNNMYNNNSNNSYNNSSNNSYNNNNIYNNSNSNNNSASSSSAGALALEAASFAREARSTSPPSHGVRHLCLRVHCPVPPDGALWIEPVITSLRTRDVGTATGLSHVPPWDELFAGELSLE